MTLRQSSSGPCFGLRVLRVGWRVLLITGGRCGVRRVSGGAESPLLNSQTMSTGASGMVSAEMSGTSVSMGMNRCMLALVSASQRKSDLGRQLINDSELADRLLPDEAVARQRPGKAASL
jgi:hypothetical protein